jgi:hypothetical protein
MAGPSARHPGEPRIAIRRKAPSDESGSPVPDRRISTDARSRPGSDDAAVDVNVTTRGDVAEPFVEAARRTAQRVDHLAGGRATRVHVHVAQDGPPGSRTNAMVTIDLELDGDVHRVRAADTGIPCALDRAEARLVGDLRQAAFARGVARRTAAV